MNHLQTFSPLSAADFADVLTYIRRLLVEDIVPYVVLAVFWWHAVLRVSRSIRGDVTFGLAELFAFNETAGKFT